MKLSNYVKILEGNLITDGEFDTLEYCTSLCKKSFLSFMGNPKYLDKMNKNISCIITTKEIQSLLPDFIKGIIIVENPKKSFVSLHNYLAGSEEYRRKEFPTQIGKNCNISPLACIAEKNVVIGDHVQIAPFTVIKENVMIGDNCIIHENCVIGGKSFNYTKMNDGQMLGMLDLGQVILENNVEVCPMCHIASGPLPSDITRLKENVKMDAFVQVGHGTVIGERTLVASGVQIAGNVVIGDDVWIGVNATVTNRVMIKDRGRVSLGSVVTRSVEENQTVTGNFAVEHTRFLRELRTANQKALQEDESNFC